MGNTNFNMIEGVDSKLNNIGATFAMPSFNRIGIILTDSISIYYLMKCKYDFTITEGTELTEEEIAEIALIIATWIYRELINDK